MKILLGFYYGIGDFISAIPIVRELSKSYDVAIAIGNQNKGLEELVNIGNTKIIYFPLFSPSKANEVIKFISILKKERFDKIVVSPHAQDAVTSWKIPLMLKYIKSSKTKIIGSIGDKNSFLYDIKIPIDKSVPLMQREIDYIKLSALVDFDREIDTENIFKSHSVDKNNSIVIHPGASKQLKEWRLDYFIKLTNLITENTSYNVTYIGLENELFNLKSSITQERVDFFSGSFKEAINIAIKSDCIITMDSGFGHIASALGLNHLVMIGPANPEHIKPIFQNTRVLNVKKLSCQPCNGHHCYVGHNYCMDIITPKVVYENIIESIKGIKDAKNNIN
ncbi:glycosyltransferase family 9 protein [Aliarcobacter cryaerophilus]|uniref:glycosyltransferase family 9 protein n=1 Tax=Aliarcobacter cryaerophilus TaxID=28198 RepID=UPI003DA26082